MWADLRVLTPGTSPEQQVLQVFLEQRKQAQGLQDPQDLGGLFGNLESGTVGLNKAVVQAIVGENHLEGDAEVLQKASAVAHGGMQSWSSVTILKLLVQGPHDPQALGGWAVNLEIGTAGPKEAVVQATVGERPPVGAVEVLQKASGAAHGGMRSWLVACHGSGRMAVRELQGQQQRKMGPEEVAQLHEVLGELAGVLNVW